MKIGILALQGAFREHEEMLYKINPEIKCIEIRQKNDLEKIDGIILPGGESTVQGKLLKHLDMLKILQEKIKDGLPVMATCAGLILLAEKIDNDSNTYLATLPVTVRRNAYGRQLASFKTTAEFGNIGNIPMTFIRAPYITDVKNDVKILAENDDGSICAKLPIKYLKISTLKFKIIFAPPKAFKFLALFFNSI